MAIDRPMFRMAAGHTPWYMLGGTGIANNT